MARKLGSKNSRAGTGSIEENTTTTNTEKWVGSVAEQISDQKKYKDDIVKTIPIDFIKTDQDNPRKLKIDIELVKEIAKQFPISTYIKNETDHEWIEDYVEKVTSALKLEGKQIGDLTSIVNFAAVLKSPERLLHSIVVWKEDSTFHLISGERRVLTHALLGESHISAKILLQKPSKKEVDVLQWDENFHRENMSLFEKIERVRKFVNSQFSATNKVSQRKLSKVSGLGNTDGERYLAVIKFSSEPSQVTFQKNSLIEAIEAGKVTSLQQAKSLCNLSEEELALTLSGKKIEKKIITSPSIKISKNADNSAMQKIINLVADSYKATDILENLDLSKTKDINLAFNSLLTFLTEKK